MMMSSDSYLIRPVRARDAKQLLELIRTSAGGLSSLQPRLDFIRNYIACSEKSFSGKKPSHARHKYLMVMIDLDTKTLIGCAAVKTNTGIEAPFINFDLVGDGDDQYLEASTRFRGATEVGSLFLHTDYRADGLGRYLAKARYHLMASESWRFGDTVIAELRGICGEEGSPLYDYMFKDKLEQTFLEADMEYFDRNPDSLGGIVPIGRIATHNMPLEVRASFGQPHPSGRGAMRLLQDEGFIFSGTIDLFDAGPIMSVYRDTIRTNLDSRLGPVVCGDDTHGDGFMLVSTGTVQDFRAVVTRGHVDRVKPVIPRKSLKALNCVAGDPVRYWQTKRAIRKPNLSLVKAHA